MKELDISNLTIGDLAEAGDKYGMCTGSIVELRSGDAVKLDLLVVENERLVAENAELCKRIAELLLPPIYTCESCGGSGECGMAEEGFFCSQWIRREATK